MTEQESRDSQVFWAGVLGIFLGIFVGFSLCWNLCTVKQNGEQTQTISKRS